ncbi:MAG: DUF4097 domain-containing protein [Clostridia bacterium]|nr:DUF4097 domain-containing protein [Clostridia bacterium]
MTSFQKIIKYGAIAFAIYLCLMIIGIILTTITAIFGISIGLEMLEDRNTTMITKWEQEYSDITSMDIDLSVCKLNIKKGDTLKVDVSNVSDEFKCQVEASMLKIRDTKVYSNFFNREDKIPQVTIYLPEDIRFEKVSIETGINETNIEFLKADTVKLEMGAGKYQMEELLAKYVAIKAGAGETNIQNSKIEELKLEGGIGKLSLTSEITKTADIHCGVGKVEVNLIGNMEDYKVKASTGLGSFKIDGKKVTDNETIGDGDASIKIDAGVGETIVQFIKGL